MSAEEVALASLVVSTASLIAAMCALAVAWHTLDRGNRNASAATVPSIGESFRQGWARFWAAGLDNKARRYAVAELLNVAELACVVVNEGTLAGASRHACVTYLERFCAALEDDVVLPEVRSLRDDGVTFSGLECFLAATGRRKRFTKLRPALAAAVQLNRPAKR